MGSRASQCLALAALLAPALGLGAYTPDALARYQDGRRYQGARQWGPAVRAYEAAVQADPSLVMAYKALGTVYYEAGDRKGALYFYDRYLAAVPNDAAVRQFEQSLRASLGEPAMATEANGTAVANEAAAGSKETFNAGFDVRLPLTGIFANANDVDEFYEGESSGGGVTLTRPGSTLAEGVGLGVDYGLSNGLVFGLDFIYGPLRTNTATISGPDADTYGYGGTDNEKDTYSVTQYAVMVTPGWRFRLGKAFVLEPRLGLGVMPASIKIDYDFTPSAQAQSNGAPVQDNDYGAAGSGYVVWPELRGEYLFGNFGLGIGLGYLYNTATPMKYTSAPAGSGDVGTPVGYGPNAQAWSLSTAGFTFSLYGVWHFQPLFAD